MQIVCEIIISDLLKPSPSSAALAFIKKTKWVNYGENYFNLFIISLLINA
jgi:hypothetical protein